MIPLIPRKQMKNRQDNSINNINNTGLPPSSPPQAPQCDQVVNDDLLDKKDNNSVSNNRWRRYGIERRRQLIDQDTAEGGNRFVLNFQCRIQGYFSLSEKIINKFDESFANGNDLEATYVMGNRLVHFLTEALPMHPSYMKRDPVISRLREKSFQSLVRIKKQIDAIALRIDEEELNKYILHDFDPFADDSDDDDDDDDDEDSRSSAGGSSEVLDPSLSSIDGGGGGGGRKKDVVQWESFDGWSFDLPDKMTMTQSSDFVQDISLLSCKDLDESGDTEDTFSSSEISFQDSDGSADQEQPIYRGHGLEFLKQVSSETVRYETDSEADDSWAQESEEELEVESAPSTGVSSYDPARIALQELIINKRLLAKCTQLQNSKTAAYGYHDEHHPDDCKENQSLDFDLSPDNTFDTEEDDIWIAFDPTARLPDAPADSMERVSL